MAFRPQFRRDIFRWKWFPAARTIAVSPPPSPNNTPGSYKRRPTQSAKIAIFWHKKWTAKPRPKARLESPPPLLPPQPQLPAKPRLSRSSKVAIFWHKKWIARPKPKTRLVTPPVFLGPQTPKPAARHPNQARMLAAFWRKKWRAKPRKSPAKGTPPATAVTLQSSSARRAPQYKRDIFRWKWRPVLIRSGTPLIPPPVVPPQPQLPRGKVIQRAVFFRRKPPPRQRRRYAPPNFIPLLKTTMLIVPRKAWYPRPRKQYAVPVVGAPKTIVLGSALWAWTGQALVINGTSMITLAKKTWAWTGQPLAINAINTITLAKRFWVWAGQPLTVATSFTLVNLTKATWSWTAQALLVNPKPFVPPAAPVVTPSFAGAGVYTIPFITRTDTTIKNVTYDVQGQTMQVEFRSGVSWYYTAIPAYVPEAIWTNGAPEIYLQQWRANRIIPPSNQLP